MNPPIQDKFSQVMSYVFRKIQEKNLHLGSIACYTILDLQTKQVTPTSVTACNA